MNNCHQVALASADPYDVLLHADSPGLPARVVQQYIAKLNASIAAAGTEAGGQDGGGGSNAEPGERDGPAVKRHDRWLHMAERLRIGALSGTSGVQEFLDTSSHCVLPPNWCPGLASRGTNKRRRAVCRPAEAPGDADTQGRGGRAAGRR
eukprot:SAG22_NODE_77_length_22125_cov_46.140016_23_plen_150_part_00